MYLCIFTAVAATSSSTPYTTSNNIRRSSSLSSTRQCPAHIIRQAMIAPSMNSSRVGWIWTSWCRTEGRSSWRWRGGKGNEEIDRIFLCEGQGIIDSALKLTILNHFTHHLLCVLPPHWLQMSPIIVFQTSVNLIFYDSNDALQTRETYFSVTVFLFHPLKYENPFDCYETAPLFDYP